MAYLCAVSRIVQLDACQHHPALLSAVPVRNQSARRKLANTHHFGLILHQQRMRIPISISSVVHGLLASASESSQELEFYLLRKFVYDLTLVGAAKRAATAAHRHMDAIGASRAKLTV
jgi:hypothetical protein